MLQITRMKDGRYGAATPWRHLWLWIGPDGEQALVANPDFATTTDAVADWGPGGPVNLEAASISTRALLLRTGSFTRHGFANTFQLKAAGNGDLYATLDKHVLWSCAAPGVASHTIAGLLIAHLKPLEQYEHEATKVVSLNLGGHTGNPRCPQPLADSIWAEATKPAKPAKPQFTFFRIGDGVVLIKVGRLFVTRWAGMDAEGSVEWFLSTSQRLGTGFTEDEAQALIASEDCQKIRDQYHLPMTPDVASLNGTVNMLRERLREAEERFTRDAARLRNERDEAAAAMAVAAMNESSSLALSMRFFADETDRRRRLVEDRLAEANAKIRAHPDATTYFDTLRQLAWVADADLKVNGVAPTDKMRMEWVRSVLWTGGVTLKDLKITQEPGVFAGSWPGGLPF